MFIVGKKDSGVQLGRRKIRTPKSEDQKKSETRSSNQQPFDRLNLIGQQAN
jgi:hypothetical protein